MNEQEAVNSAVLDAVELGVDAALEAMIAVARTSMIQQLAQQPKGDRRHEPFLGFVQALVSNRQTFVQQILVKFIADHGLQPPSGSSPDQG